MFVAKHTKTNDGKKRSLHGWWLESLVKEEKEKNKNCIWGGGGGGSFGGVKSGHQKTKSSDTW
jgi:hypothetical protein